MDGEGAKSAGMRLLGEVRGEGLSEVRNSNGQIGGLTIIDSDVL